MITFFERFDMYMKYKGLNDNKITVDADISNGLIGKGRKRGALSQESISKILYSYPDLDANWLFTGEGKMLKQTTSQSDDTHMYVCMLEKKEAEINRLNREIGALQERLEAFRKMGKDQSVVLGLEYDELEESKILNNQI